MASTDSAADLSSGIDVEASSAAELNVRESTDGNRQEEKAENGLSFHSLMEENTLGCFIIESPLWG